MSTSVTQGTNRTTFADGVGIASQDLTAIGVGATQRAWESPAYANLLAFELFGLSSYDSVFNGPSMTLQSGVFTIGGGLAASATGFNSLAGAGYVGIWDETRMNPPQATDTVPRMSWTWASGDIFNTHAAATSGSTRYDLVHCALIRTALSVTRHFKDAATGAKTSSSQVIGEQLSLDVQVTTGTQSTGTPALPALPTGRHALYAVRVSDTAITEVHDFAIPVGTLRTSESIVASSPGVDVSGFNWVSASIYGYAMESSAAGDMYIFPPDGMRGNANSRLLGFSINHRLSTGDAVSLVKVPLRNSPPVLLNVVTTAIGTINGTLLEGTPVDLRGIPVSSPLWSPVWGNGGRSRIHDAHSTVALLIHAVGAGSIVFGVTWYWIQG